MKFPSDYLAEPKAPSNVVDTKPRTAIERMAQAYLLGCLECWGIARFRETAGDTWCDLLGATAGTRETDDVQTAEQDVRNAVLVLGNRQQHLAGELRVQAEDLVNGRRRAARPTGRAAAPDICGHLNAWMVAETSVQDAVAHARRGILGPERQRLLQGLAAAQGDRAKAVAQLAQVRRNEPKRSSKNTQHAGGLLARLDAPQGCDLAFRLAEQATQLADRGVDARVWLLIAQASALAFASATPADESPRPTKAGKARRPRR